MNFCRSKSTQPNGSTEPASPEFSQMQPPAPPPPSDDPAPPTALQPTHLRARPTEEIRARVDRSFVPFPETMSCMTRFDVAMGCTGMRGKFRQAYRYGGWRDCGEAWSDFWFCM